MTYQEILLAEKFLTEIEDLMLRISQGEILFQEAKTLDGKISSSFSQYKATRYSWNSIIFLKMIGKTILLK